MTDTKAALDALDRLSASITPYDRHPDIVKQDIDIVRQAITTPPAPTVMGDDVRAIAEFFEKHGQVSLADVRTLIRAATQPPQATDAQRLAALDKLVNVVDARTARKEFPEKLWYSAYGRCIGVHSNFCPYGDKTLYVRADIVREAALQSPAVPMDDIKIRAEWIIASDDKSQMRLIAHEILALLGVKEG